MTRSYLLDTFKRKTTEEKFKEEIFISIFVHQHTCPTLTTSPAAAQWRRSCLSEISSPGKFSIDYCSSLLISIAPAFSLFTPAPYRPYAHVYFGISRGGCADAKMFLQLLLLT